MTKKAHHSNSHRSRKAVTGAVSALGLLAVSTQVVNAEQLTVKAGDTVWDIAKAHGLSVSALEKANPSIKKISDSVDLITAGQQLTLPSTQDDASADLNADGSYTVKPGDTLSTIADRYNVSVDQLIAWNGLSAGDSLYIGQQLSITGPAANVVATPVQQPVQSASAAMEAPVVSAAPQETVPTSSAAPSQAVANPAVAAQSTSVANSNVTVSDSAAPVTSATPVVASQSAASAVAPQTSAASTSVVMPTVAGQSTATVRQTASTSATPNQVTAVSQQMSSANTNVAAANSQSYVATTPVASQASQSIATTQSQVSAAPQSSAAASQQVATPAPAQPQQSQAPATSQPAQQQTTSASQDLQHGSVVSLATKIANSNSVPYVWGGESLNGMDCSGLVKYVYANAEGKQLPHYTGALENCVSQHAVSEAKPGDLLFWGNHGSTYHTAIYTGNNQYVAAAKPGTNVASYTISPYFQPSFAGTVK
ncbi:C40 family peptidase [Limosilactobacillus caccae]|uniref:C40 family peptidase n=1 Tax=Limosilactobacillus caccae TaxID=1926284 RepID=UPI000970CB69|nr:C40 family peptidase [Limosilactobacillus caccae]